MTSRKNYRAWTGCRMIHSKSSYIPFEDIECLMESTGLTDRNGVEIYEGDYLADAWGYDGDVLTKRYPVVRDQSKQRWAIDISDDVDGSRLVGIKDYLGDLVDVVGNIYE